MFDRTKWDVQFEGVFKVASASLKKYLEEVQKPFFFGNCEIIIFYF